MLLYTFVAYVMSVVASMFLVVPIIGVATTVAYILFRMIDYFGGGDGPKVS
jgi:hypothetical protein